MPSQLGVEPSLEGLLPKMKAFYDQYANLADITVSSLILKVVDSAVRFPENVFTFVPFSHVVVTSHGKFALLDWSIGERALHPNTKMVAINSGSPNESLSLDPFFRNPSIINLAVELKRFDPQDCMTIRYQYNADKYMTIPCGVGDMQSGSLFSFTTEESMAYMTAWEMSCAREMRRFQLLCALGLVSDGIWARFLLRGLYDPRLLLFVASFLNGRKYSW